MQKTPRLSLAEKQQYATDGFLAKEGLLSPEQVERVKDAFGQMVHRYAPDRSAAEMLGPDASNIKGSTVFKAHDSNLVIQLEPGAEPQLDDLDALELQVRKFMWFEEEAAVFQEILSPEGSVASIAAELIEDDPLLYQSMALIKPPHIGSTKPWHQDNAYFSVTPLESVCGVWIAIDEATVRNGCMHMLRGQHQNGAYLHEHKRDCEISARKLDLKTLVPVPLKPGGVLFFSGMIPHETPPNRSDYRRRALQFHFRGKHSTILPGEDYDAVFRDAEGLAASCEAVRRRGF